MPLLSLVCFQIFDFIPSTWSRVQDSIVLVRLTSNAKLQFRKCQFAAALSLFWKPWRELEGHLW